MSGPQNVNPRALAMGSLEELESQFEAKGWDFFAQQFAPAKVVPQFEPEDRIKRFAGAIAMTPDGKAFLEWLLDLTCRAPYPVTTQNRDDLAMSASKHQARAAVGEAIVACVAEGRTLLNVKGA